MGKLSGKRGPDAGSPNARNAGAPRKKLDLVVMRRAASIGCNAEEIAALLGVSRATFYNHLEQDEGLQEDLDQAADSGKATLRRMQWQRAAAGSDTMLIWLGKNMLGQTDRHELTGKDGGAISYVIRAPTPVESADEWLRLHAPNSQTGSTLLESQPLPDHNQRKPPTPTRE
jgi:hypothetical protein